MLIKLMKSPFLTIAFWPFKRYICSGLCNTVILLLLPLILLVRLNIESTSSTFLPQFLSPARLVYLKKPKANHSSFVTSQISYHEMKEEMNKSSHHRCLLGWMDVCCSYSRLSNPAQCCRYGLQSRVTFCVLFFLFPKRSGRDPRGSDNLSAKSSDSDVSDVSAVSRTSSASRFSSTSYMSVQSERPQGNRKIR